MLYQTFVSQYPALAQAGQSHNNARHTSIFQTCQNKTNAVTPGIAQVRTSFDEHTRWVTENPSAGNLVDGCDLVVVTNSHMGVNNFVTNRIGDTNTSTALSIPSDCLYLAVRRGVHYVVVEKAIDPELPVFIRVANPDASGLQGIGFFTDTADGTNTVEVTNLISRDTKWCGTDSATWIASKDPNVTAEMDRQRIGLASGFAVAPLSLKYV